MTGGPQRLLRGGARAVTGVVILGASAAAVLALGTGLVPLPTIAAPVVSIDVDTSQNAQVSLVCTGAFGELGADPSHPTEAVTGGTTQLVAAGDLGDQRELSRVQSSGEAQGSAPAVITAPAGAAVAAAELQQVNTETLFGFTASACAEPTHDQWLVGGGTTLGQSTTLVLGNPAEVPATVQVTLFNGEGQIDAAQTAGVLVPPGSQRIVSLNGYAPGADRLVAHVESTGAAVTAALGISHTVDIRSYAVDTVTRQLAPSTQLVVPAVTNVGQHEHGPTGNIHEQDDFPVVVRVLAPGGESGGVSIRVLKADGTSESFTGIEVADSAVTDFVIERWPDGGQAVVIEAGVPVVGGVFGSSDVAPNHDYSWFAPAPLLTAGEDHAVAIVPGGELVIANPGSVAAEVLLTRITQPADADAGEADASDAGESADTDESTETQLVRVAAGAAVPVTTSGQFTLHSTAHVSAGVRIVSGAYLADYPVLAPAPRQTNLTVVTR
ncbi:MAG: hypothetical protein GX814_02635 [Microbacteriaceae bacterium]|nr:hypothetical protein [Microbacteriaceae bacterium]